MIVYLYESRGGRQSQKSGLPVSGRKTAGQQARRGRGMKKKYMKKKYIQYKYEHIYALYYRENGTLYNNIGFCGTCEIYILI